MLHAVVLAGGGGTRLWPASRRRTPKQLLALGKSAGESLLAATCRRLAGVVGPGQLWVVTAAEQQDAVLADVPDLARDPDGVLGAVPADHAIGDETEYRAAIARAFALAGAADAIVTVGIRPSGPETGFGYLEPGVPGPGGARVVARFVEKPDRRTAEGYVARGFLWNAGMFFFRARRILAEIERHLPPLAAGLAAIAADPAAIDRVYPTLPSISIDFGIMERTSGILVIPGEFAWNDVGSWSALAEIRAADEHGNVVSGRVVAIDARDNVVAADEGLVALLGVSGLIVVRAGNAVLVLPRERAQDVREIVKRLEGAGQEEFL
jgi:mannose-1-phosphate guanylyltransferase